MIVMTAALAVLGLLIYLGRCDLAKRTAFVVPTPPPVRRRRRRGRRQTTTRRRNPRPQPAPPPPGPQLDRAGLVAALRGLGHRVSEANRLAASIPAGIVTIETAIEHIYRRANTNATNNAG